MAAFIKVMVVNGPNLGMLDKISDGDYLSMDVIEADVRKHAERLCRDENNQIAIDIDWKAPSNHEGTLIDHLEEAVRKGFQAVVINPAKLSYYGLSLVSAMEIVSQHMPVIEVHLGNSMEDERISGRTRLTEKACDRVIVGLGPRGYCYGLEEAVRLVLDDQRIPEREKAGLS